MRVEHFAFYNDNGYGKYIEFIEDPTKTRQGELKPKQMFAIGGDKCPVRLLKFYLSKRPLEMKIPGDFV